ncbi:MAG: helix-turn-helix transcriptional regulator [Mycobacteriales bacterium]
MLTPLGLAVLEQLSERPMHPYEMHQQMKDRAYDQVMKLRPGSLYHTVERLERAELIVATGTQRSGRRPERTVYALAEAGRDALIDGVRDLLRTPGQEYPAFAVGVAFMHELPRAEAVAMLEARAVRVAAEIAQREALLGGVLEQGVARLFLLEAEFLLASRRAELSWVRSIIDDVKSGRLSWRKTDDPPRLHGLPTTQTEAHQ